MYHILLQDQTGTWTMTPFQGHLIVLQEYFCLCPGANDMWSTTRTKSLMGNSSLAPRPQKRPGTLLNRRAILKCVPESAALPGPSIDKFLVTCCSGFPGSGSAIVVSYIRKRQRFQVPNLCGFWFQDPLQSFGFWSQKPCED